MTSLANNWLKIKVSQFLGHPKIKQFLNRPRVKGGVERLKNLDKKAIIIVFVLVAAGNAVFAYEKFQPAIDAQLVFYKLLWSVKPGRQYNARVSVVRIDDSLHWGQTCDYPTSRHLLAQLIKHASQEHRASVIALDVELFVPKGRPAGWHNPGREEADEELLRAINDAASAGVTIILPVGLVSDGKGNKTRIPNIYKDEELPLADAAGNCGYEACAVLGFIDLPDDKREIPLQETATDWYEESKPQKIHSLALAAAEAKEGAHFGREKPTIMKTIEHRNQVLGGFLPETAFEEHAISAQDLKDGRGLAKEQGDLMLIGGVWHREQGHGPPEDLHTTPIGDMQGVMLHANYIEALLGDHFTQAVPLWLAILIDIAIGLGLYTTFALKRPWRSQIGILLILALLTYLFFVNANRYLDFVLPSLLYFVHLVYEHTRLYRKLRRERPLREVRAV